ncbi:hypothetical protein SAMN05216600_1193 [Pseudomonas cuatrocienegasensis]|uniref:Uncharacterized protein n=1 Tax=Pseudomonas cuatrocienegasensis TaxID=543360 RepID=A0ABY1BND6_9PSED|nr:hypothetical protein SAMN05216600_1193 [Pseudomonas cuatrocienegasensis]
MDALRTTLNTAEPKRAQSALAWAPPLERGAIKTHNCVATHLGIYFKR